MTRTPKAIIEFPDRFGVACSDPKGCPFRSCMWPGQDKGTFVRGVGYTKYHDVPRPVCLTRDADGCPHPRPEPDVEHARCCHRPTYRNARTDRKSVTCAVCGATAPGWAAKLLNALPTLPGVPCKHPASHRSTLVAGWTRCLDCGGVWDKTSVQPHEVPTKTREDELAEFERVVMSVRVTENP